MTLFASLLAALTPRRFAVWAAVGLVVLAMGLGSGVGRAQKAPEQAPKPDVAAPVSAPVEGEEADAAALAADPYKVSGIGIDVTDSSGAAARLAGFTLAQQQGWASLWARLTGKPVTDAPKLAESALSPMIAGVEVEEERFASNRYRARLTVVFDPAAVRRHSGLKTATLTTRSRPILLLPVLTDAGTSLLFERPHEWSSAWRRATHSRRIIDYVMPRGDAGDAAVLNAWQLAQANRRLMAMALLRYAAEDYVVAEARLDRRYPDGPVHGIFSLYHGPRKILLARFTAQVTRPKMLPVLFDTLIQRMDEALVASLQTGQLTADAGLVLPIIQNSLESAPVLRAASVEGVEVVTATPNAEAYQALESQLRAVSGMTGVSPVTLSLGGISRLRLVHAQTLDWLLYALDQAGYHLARAEAVAGSGADWILRPRRPEDPRPPRPLTEEERAAAQSPADIPLKAKDDDALPKAPLLAPRELMP